MSWSDELGEMREVQLAHGTIRYRERGSGPTIVFVHGLMTNPAVWRKVVPELSREFRCVAPYLPLGSHELPVDPDADLTFEGLADLVGDFLEALDLRDPTLVGITAGGAICQVLAVRRPERIGRLVLLPSEAYDNVPPLILRYLRWSARVPGLTSLLLRSMRLRFTLRGPFAYGWTAKRPFEADALDAFVTPVQSNRGVRRDIRKVLRTLEPSTTLAVAEELHRFDRPVLLVWSREDRLLPFEHGERLAEAFPNARLETVEDSYTYVVQDQPQRVVELVRGFVSDRASAPAAVAS